MTSPSKSHSLSPSVVANPFESMSAFSAAKILFSPEPSLSCESVVTLAQRGRRVFSSDHRDVVTVELPEWDLHGLCVSPGSVSSRN